VLKFITGTGARGGHSRHSVAAGAGAMEKLALLPVLGTLLRLSSDEVCCSNTAE
jgi:hypothetical protein